MATFEANLNMNQVCNYETIQGIQQSTKSYLFFSISNFVWMLQMFTWMPQHKDIEIGPLKKKFKSKKLITTSS